MRRAKSKRICPPPHSPGWKETATAFDARYLQLLPAKKSAGKYDKFWTCSRDIRRQRIPASFVLLVQSGRRTEIQIPTVPQIPRTSSAVNRLGQSPRAKTRCTLDVERADRCRK